MGTTASAARMGLTPSPSQPAPCSLQTLSLIKLTWTGPIACSDSRFFCAESDKACVRQHQTTNQCPPPPPSKGQCPSGNGTEAGFALGPNSVSSQIFNSGILGPNNTVMSFCYLPPPINRKCLPELLNVANRSRVIFGSDGLPPSIKNLSSLHSADLKFATFHGFVELRSQTNGAIVPSFTSPSKPTRIRLTSTLLWDTGAYGQSTVPLPVFKPYYAYFQASLKSAWAKGLKIVSCPASSVEHLCGSNFYKDPKTKLPMKNVCNMIKMKGKGDAAEVSKAQADLLSLFPSINISFDGGGVASLPGAFIVNDCKGGPLSPSHNSPMTTSAVAVCSFLQPAPTNSTYYWLSNPFFTNRYTRFVINQWPIPDEESNTSPYIGKIYWSDPIDDCD